MTDMAEGRRDRTDDEPEEEGLTEEEVELFQASYERNRGAMERLAEL